MLRQRKLGRAGPMAPGWPMSIGGDICQNSQQEPDRDQGAAERVASQRARKVTVGAAGATKGL